MQGTSIKIKQYLIDLTLQTLGVDYTRSTRSCVYIAYMAHSEIYVAYNYICWKRETKIN